MHLITELDIGGIFFFFSSRRRHTRCSRDWSSDVCSSDLPSLRASPRRARARPSECSRKTRTCWRGERIHACERLYVIVIPPSTTSGPDSGTDTRFVRPIHVRLTHVQQIAYTREVL